MATFTRAGIVTVSMTWNGNRSPAAMSHATVLASVGVLTLRGVSVTRQDSGEEPAEYVVARDAPTEDSVEVPWADDSAI